MSCTVRREDASQSMMQTSLTCWTISRWIMRALTSRPDAGKSKDRPESHQGPGQGFSVRSDESEAAAAACDEEEEPRTGVAGCAQSCKG